MYSITLVSCRDGINVNVNTRTSRFMEEASEEDLALLAGPPSAPPPFPPPSLPEPQPPEDLPPVPTAPAPVSPPQPPQAASSIPSAPPRSAAEAVRATAAPAAIEDVVLRSPGDKGRAAGSTSLAAILDTLEKAGSIEDLHSLLQQDCVREIAVGAYAEAVARCCSYVSGLARPEEKVLCGWPVLSINEWGSQQPRTLVLSSHALYRVAFSHQKGAIDHYSRTSLGSLQAIERGRYAFKLLLTEPDGRENPISYFWSAYVKKNTKDNRYERVYYPIHPETLPVELALACILSAVDVANKLMVEKIGSYAYVSRLEIRDYVPNPNAVDELMDKVGPAIETGVQKVGEVVTKVFHGAQSAAHSAAAASASAAERAREQARSARR